MVLPPAYDAGAERYPVVYWLHGDGGNESRSVSNAHVWRKLTKEGTIRPVILAYPNGGSSSYMNHHDGVIQAETMILWELIPLIDATYQTQKDRACRAVHGMSMGAEGALRFTLQFLDLFANAVAYGGGCTDLQRTEDSWVLDILEKQLRLDLALLKQNNGYYHLSRNAEALRDHQTRFLLICGDADPWYGSAVQLHYA